MQFDNTYWRARTKFCTLILLCTNYMYPLDNKLGTDQNRRVCRNITITTNIIIVFIFIWLLLVRLIARIFFRKLEGL
jgi:hypothetical protein